MKLLISLAILIFCLGLAHSLTCWKCLNKEGNCSKDEMQVCSPSQDTCFFEIKQYYVLAANTVKRDCGTSNACRRYRGGTRGFLHRSMYCCSSDLCQPLTYHVSMSGSKNGLTCQNCIGSSADCGHSAPSEPCYEKQDRCVQISQRFLPGEEQEAIIKGCGDTSFADTLVAYQIGKDFAYVDQKHCGQSNCNNRSFPVISPGQPNGLQCFTCRESGRGECARDRLQLLNCMGMMDQCVHIVENENRTATIQKGCGTETMCNSSSIYHGVMRQDSFAKCCKTNLCNQAGDSSAPEMLLLVVVAALGFWLVQMTEM